MNPEDASVAVPDEPEGPRDSGRSFVVILSLLGLVGGAIFLLALLTSDPTTAPDREAAVQKGVHSLVEAVSRGDGESFRARFDSGRLLRESVRVGVLTDSEGVSPEDIGAGMAEVCRRGVGTHRQWLGVRVTRVSLGEDGETADVFARIRRSGGVSRLHFRLARAPDGWKVFDWESMEEGLRISSFVPTLLSERVAQDSTTEGARAVVSGIRGAMLLAAGGEYKRALDVLGKMRAAPPSTPFHAAIARLEAEYHLHLGKPQSALEAVEAGARNEDASPMLILYRAEALSDLGRHEESLEAAESFLDRMGDDPEALHLAGVALRELGKEEEAVARFRKGILLDPEDYRNRFDLGIHLLGKGRTEEGAEFLIESCRHAPERLGYFESVAPELAAARAYSSLYQLTVDQICRTPSDTHVAFYRAFALRRLGMIKDAEPVLRAALQESDQGDRPGLRSELALTLAQTDRREEAHELMERVEREDAVWGDYLHACLETLAGLRSEAIARLTRILALDASYHRDIEWEPILEPLVRTPEFRSLLRAASSKALFQEEVGEALERETWDDMLAAVEARLRVSPDPDAYFYKGLALHRLARYGKSRESLLEGMRIAPEGLRPAFWEELAIVAARMGRASEAHEHADRLARTERLAAAGVYVRARVFAIEGKEGEAVKTLKELLEIHPGWRVRVEAERMFEPLRKRPDVKELLRRAAGR